MRTSGINATSFMDNPNISERDKELLSTTLQKPEFSTKGVSRYNRQIADKIGQFLVHETDLSLEQWDASIVKAFARYAKYSTAMARRCIRFLTTLLQNTGIECSSILHPEDFAFLSDNYIFTFSQFYAHACRRMKEQYKQYPMSMETNEQLDENSITMYSTPLAIYYLSWLGLTGEEITNVKREDYNSLTDTILYNDKVYSLSEFEPIKIFFKKYNASIDYYALSPQQEWKIRSYKPSIYLVKQIRDEDVTRLNNYSAVGKDVFGYNVSTVLASGRYYRLYKYEQLENKSITFDNGDALAELLGMKKTSNGYYYGGRGNAIAELINGYPEYKRLREAALGKNG